jgi:AP-4 complex subunit mu-1
VHYFSVLTFPLFASRALLFLLVVQGTSTETLKNFIYNEPVIVEAGRSSRMPTMNAKTVPSMAAHKPITYQRERNGKQKNEIFVDILERLNVLFSPNGYILNSTVDGCIQMKSYLSGNPELKLALNEDLVIGKGDGSVVLDDANFHECCQLQDFETDFLPPRWRICCAELSRYWRVSGSIPSVSVY